MTKKSTFVPAKDLSKLWRAIIEFDMLQPGDRILVGLSGGKDSMLLTAMLAEIKKYSPIPFDLACYTVNGMFAPNFPKAELEAFCAQFGLTHYSDDVDVMAAHEKKGGSPCFTCACFLPRPQKVWNFCSSSLPGLGGHSSCLSLSRMAAARCS